MLHGLCRSCWLLCCVAFLLACRHFGNVLHYIYGAFYSVVMWRSSKMWASGVAKWRGLLGGCKRKFLFVLGATPNFVLRERTLYLCERIIWVYWGLSLVRVSLHHLYSLHLLVKFLLVAARRCRLKVEPSKFLVLSCVCVSILLSTLLHSFLLFGKVFQRSIIFSQSILYRVLPRGIFHDNLVIELPLTIYNN